jgi:SpoVK/Ycf46/Vps4 family AAA+-type ATPase
LAEQVRRDIIHNLPQIGFKDVVGLSNAKRLLKEAIWMPRMMPEVFQTGRSLILRSS